MPNVTHVTDETFKEIVLDSELPILVDFWAEWCGPCKMIGPIIEQLSDEYQGRLKVGKVDVDKNPQVATQLGIRGIPALILFKGGKPIEQIIGAVPKAHIIGKIEPHL